MKWEVYIWGAWLKIGCEIHEIKEWKVFSDERIARMHPDALVFWKENKEKIIFLAETQCM
jgi:ABC-type hemin transport system substrate-binding protein